MHINEQSNYLDHMMKQTRQHHVSLSAMADVKANMLLIMSSVVATLCLPQLVNVQYRPAVVTLILFCLIIELQEEIYACPACSYTDGFHVSFQKAKGSGMHRVVLICPSCHGRFKTGWQAVLDS